MYLLFRTIDQFIIFFQDLFLSEFPTSLWSIPKKVYHFNGSISDLQSFSWSANFDTSIRIFFRQTQYEFYFIFLIKIDLNEQKKNKKSIKYLHSIDSIRLKWFQKHLSWKIGSSFLHIILSFSISNRRISSQSKRKLKFRRTK